MFNTRNTSPSAQDKFVLQMDDTPGLPCPRMEEFANACYEAIRFQMWKDSSYHPSIIAIPLNGIDRLDRDKWQGCIPVGSIEFTERVMDKIYHIPQLHPVNVPFLLRQERFFKRRIAIASGAEAVHTLYKDWGVDELFVKSASRVKTNFSGIYKESDINSLHSKDPMLFVSAVLPMRTEHCSEWRAFVSRGRIVDIRNYAGNPWVLPDRELVEEMARATETFLDACTVDVMITDEGETALVEVHNFISCGLYGAELPLSMFTRAFRQEVRKKREGFVGI